MVKIGALELLVEVTSEKYGSGTLGYCDTLVGLNGQEMPYGRLVGSILNLLRSTIITT